MSCSGLTLDDFLARFQLLVPTETPPSIGLREAAVLVPIIRHREPSLLLTQRAWTLRKHPGQIAFPGGMRDSTDPSLMVTALREAEEEIAVPTDAVEIIGRLPSVDSASGFRVTPFVGLIDAGIPQYASESEVAAIFEMPLAEALRLGRYHPLDISRQTQAHRVWLSWYEQYFVWGMTASIIHSLALQVSMS